MSRWSIWKEDPARVRSLIGCSFISNIPRGMFMGFVYMIIIHLVTPAIEGNQADMDLLRAYSLVYAGIFLVYFVLTLWSQTNNYVQAYRISTGVRMKLGDKLRRLSLGFFKSHDPGDVTSRILHDVSKAEHTLSHTMPELVTAVTVPLLLGGFLFFLSGGMAVVLVSGLGVSVLFTLLARKIISRLGEKHIRAITETSSRILEYAATLKLLKAFNMTGKGFVSLDRAMLKLKKLSFTSEVYTGIPVQISMFLLDTAYIAALVRGAELVAVESLSVADMISFSIIGFYFLAPVKELWVMLVLLRHAGLSARRISDVFSTEELPVQATVRTPEDNTITFSDVSFSYGGNRVLQDMSCTIPANSLTALVGHSGSGKTTMANLIARFNDVDSGEIRIGGVELSGIQPEELMGRISMVFQDVYLFNDTVEANIRTGKPDATMEEVMNAAKLANCHGFIEELPLGYKTMVAEGGSSLSGGEKQRISIARAILKDAPIVLLDEATASLDPENEADVQKAFENLTQNRTVVVIAHRFSTIRNADSILVINNGRVAEQGTHEQLLSLGGVYADLWATQQKTSGWKLGA